MRKRLQNRLKSLPQRHGLAPHLREDPGVAIVKQVQQAVAAVEDVDGPTLQEVVFYLPGPPRNEGGGRSQQHGSAVFGELLQGLDVTRQRIVEARDDHDFEALEVPRVDHLLGQHLPAVSLESQLRDRGVHGEARIEAVGARQVRAHRVVHALPVPVEDASLRGRPNLPEHGAVSLQNVANVLPFLLPDKGSAVRRSNLPAPAAVVSQAGRTARQEARDVVLLIVEARAAPLAQRSPALDPGCPEEPHADETVDREHVRVVAGPDLDSQWVLILVRERGVPPGKRPAPPRPLSTVKQVWDNRPDGIAAVLVEIAQQVALRDEPHLPLLLADFCQRGRVPARDVVVDELTDNAHGRRPEAVLLLEVLELIGQPQGPARVPDLGIAGGGRIVTDQRHAHEIVEALRSLRRQLEVTHSGVYFLGNTMYHGARDEGTEGVGVLSQAAPRQPFERSLEEGLVVEGLVCGQRQLLPQDHLHLSHFTRRIPAAPEEAIHQIDGVLAGEDPCGALERLSQFVRLRDASGHVDVGRAFVDVRRCAEALGKMGEVFAIARPGHVDGPMVGFETPEARVQDVLAECQCGRRGAGHLVVEWVPPGRQRREVLLKHRVLLPFPLQEHVEPTGRDRFRCLQYYTERERGFPDESVSSAGSEEGQRCGRLAIGDALRVVRVESRPRREFAPWRDREAEPIDAAGYFRDCQVVLVRLVCAHDAQGPPDGRRLVLRGRGAKQAIVTKDRTTAKESRNRGQRHGVRVQRVLELHPYTQLLPGLDDLSGQRGQKQSGLPRLARGGVHEELSAREGAEVAGEHERRALGSVARGNLRT